MGQACMAPVDILVDAMFVVATRTRARRIWHVVIIGQMFMQDIRNHMMSKYRIQNHMMSKYLFEIAPSLTMPPTRSQYSTQLGGHNTDTPREKELAEHIMIVKRIGCGSSLLPARLASC